MAAGDIRTPGSVKRIMDEELPIKDHPDSRGNLYLQFDVLLPVSGSVQCMLC